MEVSVTYAPLRTELCQGRTRCRGTPIAVDLLCWKIEAPEFEDPQFLHWGCGTPGLIEVFVEGGKLGIERLSASDIYRVERAIRHERIPADDVSPDAFIFDYDLELAPREKPSRIKGKVTLAFMSKVDTEIVGTSHYGGEVRVGEHVSLQREENEHDSFSIAVVNLQGKQVGHVPAFIAHRLAPLLDRKWVYPVAIAAASTIREDTSRVPMLLKLYSTEANRDALGPLLAKWSEIKNPVELPPPRKSATLGWHGTSTAIWR